MKTLKFICTVAILAVAISSCKNKNQPEVTTVDVEISNNDTSKTLDTNATYAKVEFGIDGMTCAMGCAKTIEKKMAKLEGVKSAKVDFDKRIAMVEYDAAKITHKSLKEVVAKVGDAYKVKDIKSVTAFSTEKKDCKAECKKECCTNKSAKDKKACAEDCKKECCSKQKKAKK